MYNILKKLMEVAEGIGAVCKVNFNEKPESWRDEVAISGKMQNGDGFEITYSIKSAAEGDE